MRQRRKNKRRKQLKETYRKTRKRRRKGLMRQWLNRRIGARTQGISNQCINRMQFALEIDLTLYMRRKEMRVQQRRRMWYHKALHRSPPRMKRICRTTHPSIRRHQPMLMTPPRAKLVKGNIPGQRGPHRRLTQPHPILWIKN